MKRFISLLLALMFMLALAVPAFATEGAPVIDEETLAEAEAIAQKLAIIEGYVTKIKTTVFAIIEKVKALPAQAMALKDKVVGTVTAKVNEITLKVTQTYNNVKAKIIGVYEKVKAFSIKDAISGLVTDTTAKLGELVAKAKAFVAERGPLGVVVVVLGAIVLPILLVIGLVLFTAIVALITVIGIVALIASIFLGLIVLVL